MDSMENINVIEEVVSPQGAEMDNTNVSNVETDPAVNENIEGNVDNVDGDVNNNVGEEVVEPQNLDKPVQSQEQNALFAKIRREAEQKARDKVIAEMGMEWNGSPIKTYDDYQRAVREKQLMEEAQQQGLDPQFYTDFKNMQDELQNYRRNTMITQQDAELVNDPVKGELYNQWKSDVIDMANRYNTDLKTAFSVVLEERLGEVLAMNAKKIQNDTISKINENKTTTPGSLSASNEQPTLNAWDMSDNDFEKMMERASRGELKRYYKSEDDKLWQQHKLTVV